MNLSPDTLAHVYENTLVSTESRRKYGTHSTPGAVARYLIDRLPLEDCPQDERVVVEPCSGHCIFLTLAMKRLRDILPPYMSPEERHKYFVANLRGFEADLFAKEVGGLCMMLADYPNVDGWRLVNADVFESSEFMEALGEARFVVCNPPFEEFTNAEKTRYKAFRKLRASEKPAELLLRVLESARRAVAIAFVFPRQFIDGNGYAVAREALAKRFGELEVVALPDRIFLKSATESSLLIAKSPGKTGNSVTVSYGEVYDADRSCFLSEHLLSRTDVRRRTVADIRESLLLPMLFEMWEELKDCTRLDAIANLVSHGIQWKKADASRCYSDTPKGDYRLGYRQIKRKMQAFQPPPEVYLNLDPANLRQAMGLPWELPKIVTNAGRKGRGRWRVSAFVDDAGHAFSKRFIGIWPTPSAPPLLALAAFLNGPLANAYMSTHERGRDNSAKRLRSIPLPAFSRDEWIRLEELAKRYVAACLPSDGRLASDLQPVSILVEMDAHILSGYGLPPHLERRLIDFFDKQKRPVDFPFRYDIYSYATRRALSPTTNVPVDLESLREKRVGLAKSLMEDTLTKSDAAELSKIDAILGRYSGIINPLPFEALEQMEAEARLIGLDPDSVELDDDD